MSCITTVRKSLICLMATSFPILDQMGQVHYGTRSWWRDQKMKWNLPFLGLFFTGKITLQPSPLPFVSYLHLVFFFLNLSLFSFLTTRQVEAGMQTAFVNLFDPRNVSVPDLSLQFCTLPIHSISSFWSPGRNCSVAEFWTLCQSAISQLHCLYRCLPPPASPCLSNIFIQPFTAQ